jgi:hypothetical protein
VCFDVLVGIILFTRMVVGCPCLPYGKLEVCVWGGGGWGGGTNHGRNFDVVTVLSAWCSALGEV